MKAVFEKSFAFVLRMSVDICVSYNMIPTGKPGVSSHEIHSHDQNSENTEKATRAQRHGCALAASFV